MSGEVPGTTVSGADASADRETPATTIPISSETVGGASTAARGQGFFALALGSVGVVFGDIGTSPLYAMREALAHATDKGTDPLTVVGVVSLVLWALILIVKVK